MDTAHEAVDARTTMEIISDEYTEAIRRDVRPGGLTEYHPSRNKGATPSDRTSFIAGQAEWRLDNLPSILYVLSSPGRHNNQPAQEELRRLKDKDGNTLYEQWPRSKEPYPMRDFPILPLQISSMEDPVIIEAWRRLDCRIMAEDILMRMEKVGVSYEAWNRYIERFDEQRVPYCILEWFDTCQKYKKGELSPDEIILSKMSQWNIQSNTSRGFTPGLVVPELGEDGGRIPVPPRPRIEFSMRKTPLGYCFRNPAPKKSKSKRSWGGPQQLQESRVVEIEDDLPSSEASWSEVENDSTFSESSWVEVDDD